MDRCNTEIERDGLLSAGSKGQEVTHPLAVYSATLERQLLAIEKELGLTPSARAQLGYAVSSAFSAAAQAMQDIINMPAVPLDDDA